MTTIIDANVLIALFKKTTVDDDRVRINGMIAEAKAARSRIIIPSPALSEFAAKAHQNELDFIFGNKFFQIASFDAKAAIVCGDMLRSWAAGLADEKKDRHKAKFDMQILSIAKSIGAIRLITSDNALRAKAGREKINSIGIRDLPIPDAAKQQKIQFDPVD